MKIIPTVASALIRTDDDALADFLMVENIKNKMLEKLAKKRGEGRGGWHHPTQCCNEELIEMLKEHVEKGDMVDVLNLAAMILCRSEMHGESTTNI